ncbi:MAG: hypothetical protein ABSA54_17080 [Terriglobales bacterium]|jgi:hypothetical protein
MRSRILLTIILAALFVIMSGCGGVNNCPICGTTKNGAYGVIDIIPVPEHNPTGEPGGPFNSFDISWIAKAPGGAGHNLDYVSDRIGLAVVVIDTTSDLAVNTIQGTNAVSDAGNGASPCLQIPNPVAGQPPVDIIPPIIDVFGNFTRFGCRSDLSWEGGPTFHLGSGFGANHHFGGFPGAQCCASRANGVNPMSGPDGLEVSDDGNTLFVGNGSSSVVVFDLSSMNLTTIPPTPPNVLAAIPTGVSADYDGPLGIAPCVSSWNGEAGSAADCGDDRADEMSYDNVHHVLAVINGDPGLPLVTFIDMQYIVGATPPRTSASDPLGEGDLHCLPIDPASAYGPYAALSQLADLTDFPTFPSQGFSQTWVVAQPGASFNPPRCILGQIYYDGAGGLNSGGSGLGFGLQAGVAVDTVANNSFPCPDPSNPQVFGGVSGSAASLVPGIGTTPGGKAYVIPCHHGPILDQTLGTFTTANQTAPCTNCAGAIAPAGLGGMVWDTTTGHLLQANENAIPITNIGTVDEIDPRLTDTSCGGVSCGPYVVNSYVMPNCMPTSVVQGPGNNFLIGCADHDGEAFPPSEYIVDLTPGNTISCVAPMSNCTEITNVGGVDEIWYNPGDNKYYLAARDMPNGPVMGVIDAADNFWLANVTTGANSHSIAVDPSTNHAFVPLQAGGQCTTQSSNGCVGVYAQQ